MRYAEPAAFFDPDKQKLIVVIDHTLYPKDKLNVDTHYGLEQLFPGSMLIRSSIPKNPHFSKTALSASTSFF